VAVLAIACGVALVARADDQPAPASRGTPHPQKNVAVETGGVAAEGGPNSQVVEAPHKPVGGKAQLSNEPIVRWVPSDRPYERWAIRLDLGVGGGTAGIVGRVAPGAEYRFTPDVGIGTAVVGSISGLVNQAIRGFVGAELRFFFDFTVQGGWLRLQLGGGPALVGSTGINCDTPLCGYAPSYLAPVGYGAVELSYWFTRSTTENIGAALRGQVDSRLGVEVTANLVFAGDALDLFESRRY
jgi:hypothetical protein